MDPLKRSKNLRSNRDLSRKKNMDGQRTENMTTYANGIKNRFTVETLFLRCTDAPSALLRTLTTGEPTRNPRIWHLDLLQLRDDP